MAKTANINLRIEPETKAKAEALFSNFGISVTDAINIFLNMSIMEGGFPFQIKQPIMIITAPNTPLNNADHVGSFDFIKKS